MKLACSSLIVLQAPSTNVGCILRACGGVPAEVLLVQVNAIFAGPFISGAALGKPVFAKKCQGSEEQAISCPGVGSMNSTYQGYIEFLLG